jgi:hypothetical protein
MLIEYATGYLSGSLDVADSELKDSFEGEDTYYYLLLL